MSGRDHLRAVQGSEGAAAPKRKSLLPSDLPERDATPVELAGWLTAALGLGADPVVSATRYGRHPDARAVITLRSDARITFERQGDAFEPRKLVLTIIAATGATMPHYASPDAQKIATAFIRLADLAVEADDREEAQDWADSFLSRAARNTLELDASTPEGRWQALSALEQWQPPSEIPSWAPPAERALVVIDTATGRRLVRVSDVAAHIRAESGRPISWPSLHSRMREVGWEHLGRVYQRQPGGHGRLKARLYRIPADWDEA